MMSTNPHQNSFPANDQYIHFKNWGDFGKYTRQAAGYYASILFRKGCVNSGAGLNILELGYGNGTFLSFCRDLNFSVVGIEINKSLLDIAESNGFTVFDNSALETFEKDTFDFIVALDVLEHMSPSHILDLLSKLRPILKQDGQLIARFPNGDSPFSLHDQNSDPTHVTHIGSSLISSLSKLAGYADITFIDEPILTDSNRFINILKMLNLRARSLLDLVIRNLFFRKTCVRFLSPTTLVRMQKHKQQDI